jgi:hypothetical protein
MKDSKWFTILAIALITASAATYTAQILIFKRTEETFYLLFQDMAFLPISVLIVAMIIEKMLKHIERQAMIKKLNMVVGVFFMEVGTELLHMFAQFDMTRHDVMQLMQIGDKWSKAHFADTKRKLLAFEFRIDARNGNIGDMQLFYSRNRQSILNMLENPNLLEHESFTDMLLAITHLGEELSVRKDLSHISQKDIDHLSGDIKRAYIALVGEWLNYMLHLKTEYPYLYSLAVRTNPFNPEAKPEIQ